MVVYYRLVITYQTKMTISAVIGIFFDHKGQILTIENFRGVDVPGGHVKRGETPEATIKRELSEEAGATVKNIKVIDSVTSNLGKYKNKTMVFMTGRVDSFDASKAKMMIIDDFLDIYSQDKELMKKMLQKAKK